MIGALVLKDIKLFFRNQFFAVVTVLMLLEALRVIARAVVKRQDGARIVAAGTVAFLVVVTLAT